MTSENINLTTLKRLMDNARYLKAQLRMMGENLDAISKERDELATQSRTKYAAVLSDQESLKKQHLDEIQQIRSQYQSEIDTLSSAKQVDLQNTVTKYENKLKATVMSYEEKVDSVTEKSKEKNSKLQEELKKSQESYQAVANRIRGLTS